MLKEQDFSFLLTRTDRGFCYRWITPAISNIRMTPEAVIQGELNIHRLSESLVLGFRSDKIVRVLNKAFLGSKLEEKDTAVLDNTEKNFCLKWPVI